MRESKLFKSILASSAPREGGDRDTGMEKGSDESDGETEGERHEIIALLGECSS